MDFSQIRQIGHKISQIWLTWTIINVPSSLDRIQRALPRYIDDNMTVGIMLKRKLEYKNAYFSGNIRPKKVMCALNDLWNTSLYKRKQIVINYEWKKHFDQSRQDHQNDSPKMKELDSPYADNDLERQTKTLVHGYSEAHLIHDLDTIIIQITPSEGFHPLGIFQDKLSGELNFLTLFFGSSHPIDVINCLHNGNCCACLVTFQHILKTKFLNQFIFW